MWILATKLPNSDVSILPWILDLSDHLQSPKGPETPKSLKKSPERSLGPPDLNPQKVPTKVRKVQKIVDFFDFFFDFFCRPFSELFGGSGSGGPKLLSRDFLRL